MELEGKVAIITGGGRGIGRATSLLFARHGADVVMFGRDAASLESARDEIERHSGRAVAVDGSVADSDDVARVVARCLDAFGRIDILVNNAGVSLGKSLLDTTEAEWNANIAINLTGTFLTAMAVVRHMADHDAGSIVNTSSTLALASMKSSAVYSAAKAGVVALTRSMALEWGGLGIRTNCIVPGSTDTEMMWGGIDPEHLAARRAAEDAVIPLGRVGRPDEVAEATLWLASDRASFVNGAVLTVDGGSMTEYPGPRFRPPSSVAGSA